jgi:hypothetical protein
MRRRIQYNVKDEEERAEKKWEGDLIEETDYTVTPPVQCRRGLTHGRHNHLMDVKTCAADG